MNLYTADLHFGHSAIINFDHRPFADREEMEHVLIHLWNNRVQKEDDVYILGDFCYRSEKSPVYYLRKLVGKKHLIIGNHDHELLKNEQALSYFESVEKMGFVKDGEHNVVMCHFPLAEWNYMYRDAYHVYAHIHNKKTETYEFMKTRERALNAGCMINNFAPASLRELIENNRKFQGL